jgi:hypothetical protein
MTGEILTAELFVAVLGASSLTYAEATWTQSLPDWTGAHTRAFTFFGGVTAMIVSDYVPGHNRVYAAHRTMPNGSAASKSLPAAATHRANITPSSIQHSLPFTLPRGSRAGDRSV